MAPHTPAAVLALGATLGLAGIVVTVAFDSNGNGSGPGGEAVVERMYYAPAPAPANVSAAANANAAAAAGLTAAAAATSASAWTVALLVVAATALAAAVLASGAQRQAVFTAAGVTLEYWKCLWYFWSGAGSYADCPYFPESLQARVHVRSLALISELWSEPHYRNGNFGEDMRKNLRNVAVPGTGLALSALCWSASLFKLVLVGLYPAVCAAAAVLRRKPASGASEVGAAYAAHLLTPTDWFSLWRLNCRVASYHALKTQDAGFKAEDKWTFIVDALAKGIPVSPIMELPSIVCKDRNEEGGLGIHFFKNALAGGDWIIQKALHNDAFVSSMLPENAPLSTIRIVTASSASFAPDDPAPVSCLSGVFRAGRAGALTDHDAILFDLDLATGKIGAGSVNKEWYQLGLAKAAAAAVSRGAGQTASAPGAAAQVFSAHPDCGATVSGRTIPGIDKIKQIVVDAHLKACPNVPLCGWDVALTTDGVCLLEVNLSCNFFQATVDYPSYFRFVDAQFRHLEAL